MSPNAIILKMIEKFVETMENRCGLLPGDWVLAAVSGGVDSIALLSLSVNSGYRVVVGHLDHSLRDSSKTDQEFVMNAAKKLGVPFFTERVDTRKFASENKYSLEEAAR